MADKVSYGGMITKYYKVIRQNLIPSAILQHLTFIDEETRQEIGKREDLVSTQKATTLLIHVLFQLDKEQYYKEFIDAIVTEEITYLGELLQGSAEEQDHSLFTNVLQYVFPTLRKKLEPTDILPDLVADGIISLEDQDEIRTYRSQHSAAKTNDKLLTCLKARNEDWFPNFIHILKKCEYDTTFIEDIIPGLDQAVTKEEVKASIETWSQKIKHTEETCPKQSFSTILENDLHYESTPGIKGPLEGPISNSEMENKGTDAKGSSNHKLIESCRPIIVKHLDPKQIITYMVKLEVFQQDITFVFDNDEVKACNLFLDKLLKSEEEGWYQVFLEGLLANGFEIVYRTLQGYMDVKNQEIFKKLIYLYYDTLCSQIETVEIIPHLVQTGCINHNDVQEILANKVEAYANLVLLNKISKKSEDWFAGLMHALNQTHADLAKEMIPKICSKDNYCDIVEKVNSFSEAYRSQYSNSISGKGAGTLQEYDSEEETTSKLHQHHTAQNNFVQASEQEYEIDSDTEMKGLNCNMKMKSDRQLELVHNAVQKMEISEPEYEIDVETDVKRLKYTSSIKNGKPHTEKCSEECGLNDLNLNIQNQPPTLGNTSIAQNDVSQQIDDPERFTYGDEYETYSTQAETSSDMYSHNDHHTSSRLSRQSVSYQPVTFQSGAPQKANFAYNRERTGSDDDHRLTRNENENSGNFSLHHTEKKLTYEKNVEQAIDESSYEYQMIQEDIKRKSDLARHGENTIIFAIDGKSISTALSICQARSIATKQSDTILCFIQSENRAKSFRDCFENNKLSCSCVGEGDKMNTRKAEKVWIMMPEVFINAVENEQLKSLKGITLIIFDDCALSSHQYRIIMSCYFKEKEMSTDVPQILALSNANSVDVESNDIVQLSQIFNAVNMFCIQDEKFFEVKHDVQNDDFHKKLLSIMEIIENKMHNAPEKDNVQDSKFKRVLSASPQEKDNKEYRSWLNKLYDNIAKENDQKTSAVFNECLYHLKIYNLALKVNSQCTASEALNFIDNNISSFQEPSKYNKELKMLFKGNKELETIAERVVLNPKLQKLQRLIFDHHIENQKMQVETKIALLIRKNDNEYNGVAEALYNWMGSEKKFDDFKVKIIEPGIGCFDFRNSRKLNIAELEEARTIKKCSLVLHYIFKSNEKSEILYKEKLKGQKYMSAVLTENQRQKINTILKIITKMSTGQKAIPPKTCFEGETLKEVIRQAKFNPCNQYIYKLFCRNCKEFACETTDIRHNQQRYLVVKSNFLESKVKTEPNCDNSNREMDELGFITLGKCLCKNCKNHWGLWCLYKDMEYAVITISGFTVYDSSRNEFRPRRWTDVPPDFNVLPLN